MYGHTSFYCGSFYCTSQMLHFYKLKAGSSISKKISTSFIVILLYCGGLETNPQYLQGMPILINFLFPMKLTKRGLDSVLLNPDIYKYGFVDILFFLHKFIYLKWDNGGGSKVWLNFSLYWPFHYLTLYIFLFFFNTPPTIFGC